MGVLEFFGTLVKSNVTSSAIRSDYRSKTEVNHLLIDFNSMIYGALSEVTGSINGLMDEVLTRRFEHKTLKVERILDTFDRYKMSHLVSELDKADGGRVAQIFQEHFTDRYLDNLIISAVVNTLLSMLNTYTHQKALRTLFIAIDGVPSKGKMVEQKQRRYMGSVMHDYEGKILESYKTYLEKLPNYAWSSASSHVGWNRGKITPGTVFMHRLALYLRSETIVAKIKRDRPNLKYIVSDMYEVGEGEKKIVNYVKSNLAHTKDRVYVYSPDADVILLCMLMPIHDLHLLKYNQDFQQYDLIDIPQLKENIAYYINNHSKTLNAKISFDVQRINRDIVCIATLFGNDFVPRIETIKVRSGFQNIMDAYLEALLELQDKKSYLVKGVEPYELSLTFLRVVIKKLLPFENDFIRHNDLYSEYISLGQIKYAFSFQEINRENLVSTYNQFRRNFGDLEHAIRRGEDLYRFETDELFMHALKRCINITIGGSSVNVLYLSNREVLKLIIKQYKETRNFPWVTINLNTFSHSVGDKRHRKETKDKNAYEIDIYKFRHMLDEYRVKFNGENLDLSIKGIPKFYENYFEIDLPWEEKRLPKDAVEVMQHYIEGVCWVFEYYYNDDSYLNTWYYRYEKAPLLKHISMYLDGISHEIFNKIIQGLDAYHVSVEDFFNPLEQYIYVSPMTPAAVGLLPNNYAEFITDTKNPFLKSILINTQEIADRLWPESKSTLVDCRSIPYFNKCIIKSIPRLTARDDLTFLKIMREVEPSPASIRRSKSELNSGWNAVSIIKANERFMRKIKKRVKSSKVSGSKTSRRDRHEDRKEDSNKSRHREAGSKTLRKSVHRTKK